MNYIPTGLAFFQVRTEPDAFCVLSSGALGSLLAASNPLPERRTQGDHAILPTLAAGNGRTTTPYQAISQAKFVMQWLVR